MLSHICTHNRPSPVRSHWR